MAACESEHLGKTKRDREIVIYDACMFAGKTETLIREARKYERAGVPLQVFKHPLDRRYEGPSFISSHDGSTFPCDAVADPFELYSLVRDETVVVLIDEAQFYTDCVAEFVALVEHLAEEGRIVIVAGLGLDFRGEGFGPMPELLAHATKVEKLNAVCACCGSVHANRTQRIVNGEPANYYDAVIMVGAAESYEARCQQCHVVPGKPGFNDMFRGFTERIALADATEETSGRLLQSLS